MQGGAAHGARADMPDLVTRLRREQAEQDRWNGPWLLGPLNALSAAAAWVFTLTLTGITAFLSWYLQRRMESPFGIPDQEHYVEMANGRGALVPQPFASRPLAPLLARVLSHLGHMPVEQSFVWLGWISLLTTLLVVFALAMRTAAPRWVALAIAITPFWPELLHTLALPDPLSAALLCGLLLCLAAKRPLLAAASLGPLMVARESTSLVLVCLLLVGWRQLRWRGGLVAVAAVAIGATVVRAISAGVAGNPEHLPTSLYLAAKVPWNLVRLVGIVPWSNLYPYLCPVPVAQITVHLGPLRGLGVCSVSSIPPQMAALAWLSTFGLLPLLLFVLWRGRKRGETLDLLSRFCLVYGGLSCVLAPLLGTGYSRLFGYAWPLFFVALPRLFAMRVSSTAEGVNTQGSGSRQRQGKAAGSGLPAIGRICGLLLLHVALGAIVYFNARPGLVVWGAAFETAGALLLLSPRTGLFRSLKSA